MPPTLLIVLVVLTAAALVDVWTSQLTAAARVIWSLILVFLPGVGLFAWALTRTSARQRPPVVPPLQDPEAEDERERERTPLPQ